MIVGSIPRRRQSAARLSGSRSRSDLHFPILVSRQVTSPGSDCFLRFQYGRRHEVVTFQPAASQRGQNVPTPSVFLKWHLPPPMPLDMPPLSSHLVPWRGSKSLGLHWMTVRATPESWGPEQELEESCRPLLRMNLLHIIPCLPFVPSCPLSVRINVFHRFSQKWCTQEARRYCWWRRSRHGEERDICITIDRLTTSSPVQQPWPSIPTDFTSPSSSACLSSAAKQLPSRSTRTSTEHHG